MDIPATYVEVQNLLTKDVVVDHLNVDGALLDVLEQLRQLGTTDTVRAVDGERPVDLRAPEGLLEGVGHLLVVASLADLAVGLGGALGVCAADEIVELRGGQDLVVGSLGTDSGEGVGQGADELVARGAGVAAVYDLGRGG
jgi:hypothetical protein